MADLKLTYLFINQYTSHVTTLEQWSVAAAHASITRASLHAPVCIMYIHTYTYIMYAFMFLCIYVHSFYLFIYLFIILLTHVSIVGRSSGEYHTWYSMWPQVSVPLISRPVAKPSGAGPLPLWSPASQV